MTWCRGELFAGGADCVARGNESGRIDGYPVPRGSVTSPGHGVLERARMLSTTKDIPH